MKNKNRKILAVDPGARHTGLVILNDQDLLYFGVKTFKNRKPVSTLLSDVRQVFLRIIDEYNPSILAIEKHFLIQYENLSNLGDVTEEIKSVARQKKLKVIEYSPKSVRKHICQTGKATKRETAHTLCRRYPELQTYLNHNHKWQEIYWLHMFDALAVGVTYLENGNNNHKN